MAASASRKLSLEFLLSKENDDPLRTPDVADNQDYFLKPQINLDYRDCGTSIFVECMLVMFMLETLCKICL